ncbi:hypothetical protein H6B15_00840 [Gemmiger formicilis]|uniref:hypothetical protein n=1 Tax=Gemmiger formicilis TaxID=745368 RepID=UPI00195B6B1A|nr:hypothetical protein [Gemmiger formicilis]MBM6715213.1 hypothetical protein [Gemmiger formicilis]
MMNKLLKYECLAVGRILVPIWAGTAVFALLAAMIGRLDSVLSGTVGTPVSAVLESFFQILTALFLFATIAACVVLNIQRFYKLLGDQGYLMFSLPAAPWQHMAAKLLCACGSTIASILICIGCTWMANADGEAEAAQTVSQQFSLQSSIGTVFLVVQMVLAMISAYLYLYLCMAIGSRWPQQRMLASIVTYFVLGFALQMAFVLLFALAAIAMTHLPQSVLDGWTRFFLEMSLHGEMVAGIMAGSVLLLFALADGILWAVTHRLISKNLNLP